MQTAAETSRGLFGDFSPLHISMTSIAFAPRFDEFSEIKCQMTNDSSIITLPKIDLRSSLLVPTVMSPELPHQNTLAKTR